MRYELLEMVHSPCNPYARGFFFPLLKTIFAMVSKPPQNKESMCFSAVPNPSKTTEVGVTGPVLPPSLPLNMGHNMGVTSHILSPSHHRYLDHDTGVTDIVPLPNHHKNPDHGVGIAGPAQPPRL